MRNNSGDKCDSEFQYAMRMVNQGYATIEQAAAACGLDPRTLQAKLEMSLQAVQPTEREKFFSSL